MKKIMTLVAAAMMAVGLHAQTWTPLALGGGWNKGFVGEADVFDYTINKKWAAAEFACNVSSAEYTKYDLRNLYLLISKLIIHIKHQLMRKATLHPFMVEL